MLYVDDMNQILREILLGAPEELHTAEANVFRETSRAEVAEMMRQGIMPDSVAD